jgi:hypothetical protein
MGWVGGSNPPQAFGLRYLWRIVTDPPSDAGARIRALGFAA